MRTLTIGILAAILSACAHSSTSAHPSTSQGEIFVLVHGALFDGKGWSKLERELAKHGHLAVSLDVPGRNGALGADGKPVDLYKAAAAMCTVVARQDRPVILVGHSQGGAVINQALSQCAEQVKGLIYIAAVAPLGGEIPFQALNPKRDVGFGKVATPDPKAGVFRLNKAGPVRAVFFADLPEGESRQVIGTMVSEPMGIGLSKMTTPTAQIAAKPKAYIETLDDQVISIQTQREIRGRLGTTKVFSIKASHSPFLSMPVETAELVVRAAAGM